MDKLEKLLPAIIVAIGIAIAGIAVGAGIKSFHTSDRYVTVKGLSEREVKANTATYTISFAASGDDLQKMYAKINADAKVVKSHLLKNKMAENEISYINISANDTFSSGYVKDNMNEEFRYVVTGSYTVKSGDVYKINKLTSKKGDLIGNGINVKSDYAEYHFTKINDIKPDMISEAIAAAREAAERFAKDSGSDIAGIRRANQGSVVIRDIDSRYGDTASIDKKVRIVSTVVYNLED